MDDRAVTLALHGVLDQARAEPLATRIRAALRNGRRRIVLTVTEDTVITSASFLAFLLRAEAILHGEGGSLTITGTGGAIQTLARLRIPPDRKGVGA